MAKGMTNLLNSDPEVSLNVIRQILLKTKIDKIKIDRKTTVSELKFLEYSHKSAKSRLDFNNKKQTHTAKFTIRGIHLKLSGRISVINPWYLPNLNTRFIIEIRNMDIQLNLEVNKDLIIVPSGSKFEYLNRPIVKIDLYESGYGKFFEFFAEKILSWKKASLLDKLKNSLNDIMKQRDLIKNQVDKIFSNKN